MKKRYLKIFITFWIPITIVMYLFNTDLIDLICIPIICSTLETIYCAIIMRKIDKKEKEKQDKEKQDKEKQTELS